MNHTPTPWSPEAVKSTWLRGSQLASGPFHSHVEQEANAAFIVEACNNYERLKAERDELLAALRKVVDAPNHAFATGDALFDAVEYARRAIAKAEGK